MSDKEDFKKVSKQDSKVENSEFDEHDNDKMLNNNSEVASVNSCKVLCLFT